MGVIKTKEEKARAVLEQDDTCGVDCDGGKENECPAYKQCSAVGMYRHSYGALACREHLAMLENPGVWDNAPEWATEARITWRGDGFSDTYQTYTR